MKKDPNPNQIIFPEARRALQELKKGGVDFDMSEIDPSLGGGGAAQPQTLSNDDVEAIKWARANPKDPRSAQILKLHGIQ